MAISAGDIIEFKWTMDRQTGGAHVVTRARFRIAQGTGPVVDEDAWLKAVGSQFQGKFFMTWCNYIIDDWAIIDLNIKRIKPTETFVITQRFEWGDNQGQRTTTDNFLPQQAACMTIKSYMAGRKGIGRLFVGPVPTNYVDQGYLIPSPTSLPDLQDLANLFRADWQLDAPMEEKLQLCIVGDDPAPASSSNVVRDISFGRRVSTLRSRRPGVGV